MEFGNAIQNDLSPSIDVLHDLQRRDLSFNDFVTCLEKIGCQRALNVFREASELSCTCTCMSMHICMYVCKMVHVGGESWCTIKDL